MLFRIMECTISSGHGVTVIIGIDLLGSRDVSLAFSQRFALSSMRPDDKLRPQFINHVSTVYNPGIIDGSASNDNGTYQRPAL